MKDLEKLAEEQGWFYAISHHDLTEELIEKYNINFNDACWEYITEHNPSINIIRKYKDKLNWITLTDRYNINDEFVEEFNDYIDWYIVPFNMNISEEIIDKYSNRIDWDRLLEQYQKDSQYISFDDKTCKRFKKFMYKYCKSIRDNL